MDVGKVKRYVICKAISRSIIELELVIIRYENKRADFHGRPGIEM